MVQLLSRFLRVVARAFLLLTVSLAFLCGRADGGFYEIFSGGSFRDDRFSLVYRAETGEVAVDFPEPWPRPTAAGIGSIVISSESGIFTGTVETGLPLGLGAFGWHTDNEIFLFRDGSGIRDPFTFGSAAEPRLSEEFLLEDLTANANFHPSGDVGPFDLIYVPVPEPWSMTLQVLGSLFLVPFLRFRTAR